MAQKRIIEFKDFKLTVEKTSEGRYSVLFRGALSYDYDGTPVLEGERKTIEGDFKFLFYPRSSLKEKHNLFELTLPTAEKEEKFSSWLEKVKRQYGGIED
ncbi:MAG: hypothetical protein AMJ41_02005 [candidate division Zixibacteria bacterium DG_27]|nr:MAG: hypothetical protein AMJ41_02005 [candidate division Zixibacteria bacterium DG_27]